LIKKETKNYSFFRIVFFVFMNLRFQVLRFLVGQISFWMLKRQHSLTLKQLFFLRILQTF